jgi:hypothetical protein
MVHANQSRGEWRIYRQWEREGAGVAERTQLLDLQDSKRVQADCLASLHLSQPGSVYPTYISLRAHVLPFILRPTLMTEILLTDASIDP